METDQFTCRECGHEYLGSPSGGGDEPTCSECMELRFTIGEVAAYISSWSVGEFGEVDKVSKATLHNALSQLRDPQDGIQACRLRGVLRQTGQQGID